MGRDRCGCSSPVLRCRNVTASRSSRKPEAEEVALEKQFIGQPIAFETVASWGADAKAFLTEVASRVKQATGNPRATEFLRQRVSVEIPRGNAAAVVGTVDERMG